MLANFKKNRSCFGFTLIEITIVISMIAVLVLISLPSFKFFEKKSDLRETAEEIIDILKTAQTKTLASDLDETWGVFFSTSTVPHGFTLFRGDSYLTRATSSDEIYFLPNYLRLAIINFYPDSKEVVFDRITGFTENEGFLKINEVADASSSLDIFVDNYGNIGLETSEIVSDEERIKDLRHIHFNYSRAIATSSENMILTFDESFLSVQETIVLADHLVSGQVYWEGSVDVGGESQIVKIHTHSLNINGSDSLFCVHRYPQYNSKSLKIELSGDATGFLVEYQADGSTTTKSSLYTDEHELQ